MELKTSTNIDLTHLITGVKHGFLKLRASSDNLSSQYAAIGVDKSQWWGSSTLVTNGKDEWIQASSDVLREFKYLSIQSPAGSNAHVTSFCVSYSVDGLQFQDYPASKFTLPTGDAIHKDDIYSFQLEPTIYAKIVRLSQFTYVASPSIKFELHYSPISPIPTTANSGSVMIDAKSYTPDTSANATNTNNIYTKEVSFLRPFRTNPIVTLGITSLSSSGNGEFLTSVSATNITPSGFTLQVKGDNLSMVGVDYVAISPNVPLPARLPSP